MPATNFINEVVRANIAANYKTKLLVSIGVIFTFPIKKTQNLD